MPTPHNQRTTVTTQINGGVAWAIRTTCDFASQSVWMPFFQPSLLNGLKTIFNDLFPLCFLSDRGIPNNHCLHLKNLKIKLIPKIYIT